MTISLFSNYLSFFYSGISGSGKTQASLQLLRLLFEQAGGGAETDAFKHLNAALTVLRALTTAGTVANNNSSRMVRYNFKLCLMLGQHCRRWSNIET